MKPIEPFPSELGDDRQRRSWWRRVLPQVAGGRRAVFDGWLAAAVAAVPELAQVPWHWFDGQRAPHAPPNALSPADIDKLGPWWQSAGRDRESGQWFTPAEVVADLLGTWVDDWLSEQAPGLTWRQGALVGNLSAAQAQPLLQDWLDIAVLDPAMGAGDWLIGWLRLHHALALALAGLARLPAPPLQASVATVHGVDCDATAVALAEIRLGLVSGCRIPADQLLVADSLLPPAGMAGEWLWPGRKFALILGNPPFVSTKGLAAVVDRTALLAQYGYTDDLYVHFVTRGLGRLKPGGWLLFILSDTFRTTVTKERLRDELLRHQLVRLAPLPADSFAAVVTTVAVTVRKAPPAAELQVAPYGTVPLGDVVFGPRRVLIEPSPDNRARLARLSPQWAALITAWWPHLRDTRRQQSATQALADHRRGLVPGDWTLLGLLCEGGVGLQTGDNGAFLGVLADQPEAGKVQRRRAALRQAWQADAELAAYVPEGPFDVVMAALRARFPAARLGLKRGEVWRLVGPEQLADPLAWPEDWRRLGAPEGPAWVPYEKGDPEGRRWAHTNPFVIQWDRGTVARLRRSARGRGEPVMRNPQFFFRAGVTWSNMSSHSLKARLQPPCVFDVGSMTLFPAVDWLDAYALLAWLNAAVTNQLLKSFINHTLNFQINDLRLLPIQVPDPALIKRLSSLAQAAVAAPGATGPFEEEIDRLLAAHYGFAWQQEHLAQTAGR